MIPLSRPSITDSEIAAVGEVLRSGMLVQGPVVAAFEGELAAVLGVDHVVVVNSGTAALYASLKALGVGAGDMVVVAAYSWIATANVVRLCDAEVRFVDIEPSTLGMDPRHLSGVLDSLERSREIHRVKAIIPVHVFGHICEMPEIIDIASKYSIPVIEDAACAFGAAWSGFSAGTWGSIGCFSFHPRKAITTGEGGAVATDDRRIADHVRAFRNHGQDFSSGAREFSLVGDNLRMTDFQAAMGREQLRRLPGLLEERHELARRYRDLLEGLPLTPVGELSRRTSFQSFVVSLEPGFDRDGLVSDLRRAGIEAAAGTIDMPRAAVFSAFAQECPNTLAIDRTLVTLPFYNGMPRADQEQVVRTLVSLLRTGVGHG